MAIKRICYISRADPTLSNRDVDEIGRVSVANNREQDITGVLIYSAGIFFQILEGEAEATDRLYQKISRDPRHRDLLCIRVDNVAGQREFPDWSMKTVNLDDRPDNLLRPVQSLFRTLNDSYRILGRYTQPTVFKLVQRGLNPLEVAPQMVERVTFFADIVLFSSLSEQLEVAEVVDLLNTYFTLSTEAIDRHGGEVNKLIGDSIMASFPSRECDRAIQAGLDILGRLHHLRADSPPNSPLSVLHCGIGLSCGPVLEGNIGSALKMDFTIIGNPVNVAARIEAVTRSSSSSLILSRAARLCASDLWEFEELGRFQLKGLESGLSLYTVRHPHVQAGREVEERIRDFLKGPRKAD